MTDYLVIGSEEFKNYRRKQQAKIDSMYQCTKDNPMPDARDQMGHSWYHRDAVLYEMAPSGPKVPGAYAGQMKCPNCGLIFPIKYGNVKLKSK